MAEGDVHFGDMEERHREQRRRPDRNKQLAVVSYGTPQPADVPIYVDLDAMREMEIHAASDTQVELGGVLLGGQFEDDQGEPFVLVADSLRAEHYENTKSSFKFTHETWSQITRQRDGFPDDLQMVGWYHTHPGWGVFLSVMDRFICEHFFHRDLDVALVIDPCGGDRGWYQWTGDPEERLRRTGGFFLFASRHRRAELEFFATQLEGKLMTTYDPRASGYPSVGGPASGPVVNIVEPRFSWQAVAGLGMLAMQFVLVALLVWKILLPPATADTDGRERAQKTSAALLEHLDRLDEIDNKSRSVAAQQEVLDRVLYALGSGAPDGVVTMLSQQRLENERLKDDARVYRSLESRVQAENETLSQTLAAVRADNERLTGRLAELKQTVADFRTAEEENRREIGALKQRLTAYEQSRTSQTTADGPLSSRAWIWGGAGLLLGILATLGLAATWFRTHPRRALGEPAEDEQAESADDLPNNSSERANNVGGD